MSSSVSSSRSSSKTPSRPVNLTVPDKPLARPSSPRSLSYNTPPPLHLTIRFSNSLPDLSLDILRPHETTVAALKSQIRTHLSDANKNRRLRFIHGGKILPDTSVLSSVLRAPPPSSAPEDDTTKGKGKGKGVEGRVERRVYVNCSIGDVLTPEEIEAEGKAATTRIPASSLPSPAQSSLQSRRASPPHRPRGFDRLLDTGATQADVNHLRLQFRNIQAARHTPDTMPSPDTLRSMEDAWLESNATPGGGQTVIAGEEEMMGDDQGMAGLLDTLVKAMCIGFLFPLGSVMWLIREEGMWSRRWQVFASFGFLLSFAIGLIRAMTGEGQ
ncbi:hypothetical protein DL546_001848 [Coniochaeta pulveracea]|uniref:Ubiquitin-like domain-containing protein n=1 Tax=Coniochaeta pulveracea TaxID=177199 RepID=A0A420Y646_9PEZI|nr:hypothetical protein DL546_001848 [Coniochaeta pulveracea]